MDPQQYPPQPGQPYQPGPPQNAQQNPPVGPPMPQIPTGNYNPYAGYQSQPGAYPPQPQQPYFDYNNGTPGGYGPMPGQSPYPNQPPQQMNQQPHTAGYNPNLFPGETAQPPRSFKGPVIAGIVALVVIVMLVAAVEIIGNLNKQPKAGTSATTTGTPGADIVPRSDGKLDLSARITPASNVKQQSIQANEDEQVNLSNGFSFMVTGTKPYAPKDETIKPNDGMKFIQVSVVAGNRTVAENVPVSYLDFKLRDGHNQFISPDGNTLKLENNYLASPNDLKPGAQVSGTIIFQVEADAIQWSLYHNHIFQKKTDNTSFVVEGAINTVLDVEKDDADNKTDTTKTDSTGTSQADSTTTAPTP